MKSIFEITFHGIEEVKRLAEERARHMRINAESAIANTVLLGVARIANDCPVDTGRARASLTGELADDAGVDLRGDPRAIAEGKSQSLTGFRGLKGRIGSNVEYILYLEYKGERSGPKKLTEKQLRYLFATGILQNDGRGGVIYNYQPKKSRKGFFRMNLPIIEAHFNRMMEKAMEATREGRLLRKGY